MVTLACTGCESDDRIPRRSCLTSDARASRYQWGGEAHLFAPRERPADFAYSDGDTFEDTLLALVRGAVDRALHSIELTAGVVDWPTLYHLGAGRANLLRPIERLLGSRTLEIGAGCGPLTRYLGELGGEVVAMGAPRALSAGEMPSFPNRVSVFLAHSRHARVFPPF